MARPRKTIQTYAALTIEGALIAPSQVDLVGAMTAKSQSAADYGVPKGLALRDEIARYFRIGQALFADFALIEPPTVTGTVKFIENFLKNVLGFDDVVRTGSRSLGERLYPVTLEARAGRVPIIVVPPIDRLDGVSSFLAHDGKRRSASSAIQEWLNASDDALWGIATNGYVLRILRDNASLTRPAYIEADLREMFQNENFADFAVFWLLAHSSRFGAAPALPGDCPLEHWREAGEKVGETVRDALRDGVQQALVVLGTGFLSHAANTGLRGKVISGELSLPDFFTELLRLVYRLIFLAVAEDRDLLHPPGTAADTRRLYADGYSLMSLRARSVRRTAWDVHHDRWDGLAIVFRSLARGEKLLGLPCLGGLFVPELMPNLAGARLSNRALMEALFYINWLARDGRVTPVNWRDMETEELGSVYEALLELTPRIQDDGAAFGFAEGAETKGNTRKTTGSYYTPDSLVQALLDSALDPVLDAAEAGAEDPAEALLNLTVIDPACGSGHFLLAAARRIAKRVASARSGGLASAEDHRHALRDVMRRCIHGVDRNPMAVELTKVALWIETVDPGKPLGFFDANIRCGDSLLGVYDLEVLRKGIPEAAYKPLTGDDKETARHYAGRNKADLKGQGTLDFGGGISTLPAIPPMIGAARQLRALPEDTPEQVAARARAFSEQRGDGRLWLWRVACDLYVAAFLMPKTGGAPSSYGNAAIPTTSHIWATLNGRQVSPQLSGRAIDIAAEARAFHWPIEFPDIMAAGGFDAVLGNPPWERVKLQEQEFFAALDPEIAEAPNAAARGRLIQALKEAPEGSARRRLHTAFEIAKRIAEASSVFARVAGDDGGRFPLAGRGDVNTYALFAELFSVLAGQRGRAGVIVPRGIATDATTAAFFGSLNKCQQLISLISFENEEFIFPSVHHSFQFCNLTIGGFGSKFPTAQLSFFHRSTQTIHDPERSFSLTPAEIAIINPNTRTAPIFRSRADAELTKRIYANVPVLIDEAKGATGNPWGITFSTLFHMSNDSGLFRTAAQLGAEGFEREGRDWIGPAGRQVPLYEAKMIHQFDHRWASYEGTDTVDVSSGDKADPAFDVTPRYWVPEQEVSSRLTNKGWSRGWLMGWRVITNATNERTLIGGALPVCGAGNSLPIWFVSQKIYPAQGALLLATMSSLTRDFVARHKVGGTNLNFFISEQLPVLPPYAFSDFDIAFIVPRVLELNYTSWSMQPFARDLDYDGPPFAWDEDRRAVLRAELDARIARLYGLTKDELRYILDPASTHGDDYPSETFRVLKKNELNRFKEYRTQRLVLEAWDREDAAR